MRERDTSVGSLDSITPTPASAGFMMAEVATHTFDITTPTVTSAPNPTFTATTPTSATPVFTMPVENTESNGGSQPDQSRDRKPEDEKGVARPGQKMGKPMKARVRRYSTMRAQHHVEEYQVDFQDSSSEDSSGEENIDHRSEENIDHRSEENIDHKSEENMENIDHGREQETSSV